MQLMRPTLFSNTSKYIFVQLPAPVSFFFCIIGIFIENYRADYYSSHFRSLCSFLRCRQRRSRSNVVVFCSDSNNIGNL